MASKLLRIFLCLILILTLLIPAGCGKNIGGEQSEPSEISQSEPQKKQDDSPVKDLKIEKTPSALLKESLKEYSDPNGCFTALVPEGWSVSCGGKDMYF